MSDSPKLPYGRHTIDQDDINAVVEVLRSDYLTSGPAVERFEGALCEVTGAAHAVACTNGTTALHLAAAALGIGPEDWVVVPAVTFLATANAARYVGAEVAFADVDPGTGLMTPETLEATLERCARDHRRVRVAFPVHLNGQVVDLPGVGTVAGDAGVDVVDDACHAIGATFDSPVGASRVGDGAHAAMSTFSFHPVKTVAMGEGGAVTTNDPSLADRLRRLRNHGMTRNPDQFTEREQAFDAGTPNPWYYEMPDPGHNFRASDLHCALGASQLSKLHRFVADRQSLVDHYDQALEPLAPAIRPVERVTTCEPAWHLYVALVDFDALGRSRADVMRRLSERGIATQVHYLPVNRQPYYRRRYGSLELAGADAYYERCLTLPLFASMSMSDADRVVGELAAACGLGRLLD